MIFVVMVVGLCYPSVGVLLSFLPLILI